MATFSIGRNKLKLLLSLCALGLIVGLLWLATCWLIFQRPQIDEPVQGDALFVLGPPEKSRVNQALELMEQNIAPVLVLSNPGSSSLDEASSRPYYTAAMEACAGNMEFDVICFQPSPSSTQGEAIMLRELAIRNNWDQVNVLTHRQHIPRARIIIERCYTGNLHLIATNETLQPTELVREFRHEFTASIKSLLTPSCEQELPWK